MKKLMMAVCAVALAGVAQAGAIKWANYGMAAVGCDDQSQAWSGRVYLMDAASMTAEAFVTAYIAGGANQAAFESLVSGAMNYAMLTSEAIDDGGYYIDGGLSNPNAGTAKDGAVTFGEYSAGTEFTLYNVAFDEASKALFVSEDVDIPASGRGSIPGTGAGSAEFYNDASLDGVVWDTKDGYQGEGWYTTSAVPEPTSGLLLLLGVAGLALRRRRA